MLADLLVVSPDRDLDSVPTYADDDDDGDGVLDGEDIFPLDPNESVDTDSDGIGDNSDTDDDGDGLNDIFEVSIGTNPLLQDTDRDGASDGHEVADGTDPLDSNSGPSSGISMVLIKAFLDKKKESVETDFEM